MEQRLFHTADYRVRHLAASPDGNEVAATVAHDHFMTHIGVMGRHGGGLQEVTEGDSVDAAPRWVPGNRRQLVYDFLAPQARADGSLLFIRKPRAAARDTKANAWSALKDAALFPFRLTGPWSSSSTSFRCATPASRW